MATFIIEVVVWVEADDDAEAKNLVAETLASTIDTGTFDIVGAAESND